MTKPNGPYVCEEVIMQQGAMERESGNVHPESGISLAIGYPVDPERENTVEKNVEKVSYIPAPSIAL